MPQGLGALFLRLHPRRHRAEVRMGPPVDQAPGAGRAARGCHEAPGCAYNKSVGAVARR